ncbi:MAG TPA: type II toxin-antitoxin system VapC family toxin [Gammaproteobacteria bacterium]|jgi:predicted nucleic acid-binding protein|nr:type II toxin-antitoxin system VapC family toxin [Gammaproteobacteria bacterium]
MKTENLFVLDCSVTIAWILFADDMTEKANKILAILEQGQAKVPTIWPLEVANVLCMSVRSKKISPLEVAEFKELLAALPINIDNTTSLKAMGSIYTLAEEQHLTIYDAAYLEIAIRDNIPLATFDKALKKAAQKIGVKLI